MVTHVCFKFINICNFSAVSFFFGVMLRLLNVFEVIGPVACLSAACVRLVCQ